MEQKKVLVLGGTGAMGVYVVPELLEMGGVERQDLFRRRGRGRGQGSIQQLAVIFEAGSCGDRIRVNRNQVFRESGGNGGRR